VIGGMCTGAAALHAVHLPTALGFILPAGLPVAARFAADGTERGLAAAAMIGVFLATLAVSARRSSGHFGDTVRLRLDLAAKARELDAANARLRREMAEHRATEASLRHAQKLEAVGQLTGGIAHDFNNLLTAVLGSLALLRKRLPEGDERAARLLDNAVEGARRGAALTQRLLAFGRRQALRPDVVDLPSLVHGMSALLRSSLGAGIRVETRFPAGLAPAYVDANQLELALLNLVVNARDAMAAGGGAITIAAESRRLAPPQAAGDGGRLPPGDYVVLSVADTGEGMDEATLARAMEPFFTTKGVGKGTGLGLAMVHGLAAQSGGRFVLRSRKGAGTVAELWLPQAEAAAEAGTAGGQAGPPVPEPEPERAAPPLPSASAPAPLRRTVMLVDDDPLVLASASAMLEDLGHRVIEAASGARALELLRAGAAADLVITDYAMPGMTGLQLAEALRRLRPGLPVLLATGYGELRGDTAAGLARLPKPFGQDSLARAIAASLGETAGAGAAG
jgi:signal transduction histidine kinase